MHNLVDDWAIVIYVQMVVLGVYNSVTDVYDFEQQTVCKYVVCFLCPDSDVHGNMLSPKVPPSSCRPALTTIFLSQLASATQNLATHIPDRTAHCKHHGQTSEQKPGHKSSQQSDQASLNTSLNSAFIDPGEGNSVHLEAAPCVLSVGKARHQRYSHARTYIYIYI